MKLPKLQHPVLFLSIFSVVVGIVVYFGTGPRTSIQEFLSSKFQPAPRSTQTSTPTPFPKGRPRAINIPKINKVLTIRAATVKGNTWDMFDDAVAWLSTSAVPGEGNVILYAHNWQSLWRDLSLLQVGDTIEVLQDNTWKKYVVSESRSVVPEDTESILSDNDQLTMYTCEGSFDQKRRVVYAKPVL